MEFNHISVLLEESVEMLKVKPGGVYADGTLGGGGHSSLICSHLSKDGTLIGIDRDETALLAASERLSGYECKKILCHDNFFNIKKVIEKSGIDGLDGAILDLGVSSPQLDTAERGFSYNMCGALDMRMDKTAGLDAYTVVNTYDEKKLADIIFKYGEERHARRVANAICRHREAAPIETTTELSEIIKEAFPPSARYADKHPAKRTFQAIRIEVNGELDAIEPTIRNATDILAPEGRIAIITFHSLEDRIVKQTYADLASGCNCPRDLPVCVCGRKPRVNVLTRKPILPSERELEENPRSRSAKLRVAEKI